MSPQTRKARLTAIYGEAFDFVKSTPVSQQTRNAREDLDTPSSARAKPFKEILAESIGEVRRLETEADSTIKKIVSGQLTNVSEAMRAVEEAGVSFQAMMTVRDEIAAVYAEVKRV